MDNEEAPRAAFVARYGEIDECESRTEKDAWRAAYNGFTLGWNAAYKTYAAQLAAARAVIAAFVYPFAPMTPEQTEAVRAWQAVNALETEPHDTPACATCGSALEAVRPGKWQCPKCEG